MKTAPITLLVAFIVLQLTVPSARAQGTAFTYQGRLDADGSPATGNYDVQFTLFATNNGGTAIGRAVTDGGIAVTNGLFTAAVDFGAGVFTGTNYWLDLAVRTNGASSFTELTPRQALAPIPYAVFANTASNLSGTLSVSQLNGTLPPAQLPAYVVTNTATGVTLSGTFSGNGAGLTNVTVAQLPSGTVTNLQSGVTLGGLTTVNNLSVMATNFVNYLVVSNAPVLNGSGITNLTLAALPAGVVTNKQSGVTFGGQTTVSNLSVSATNFVNYLVVTNAPVLNGAAITNLNFAALPAGVVTNYATNVVLSGLSVAATNVIAPFTVPAKVPAAIGSANTGANPYSIAVAGRYVYVANYGAGTLQVFDVSTPTTPVSLGSIGTANSPRSVAVAGRYAYVANYNANSLQVFEISAPSGPILVGSAATGSNPYSVAIAGRYAYVVNYGASTLQVFDVSTPTSPVSVGSASTGGSPIFVTVAGRYAYVANYNGSSLQVFDVSIPANPISLGTVSTGNQPNSVAVAGRYAYVVNNGSGTLQVFDVSTPASPLKVGSANTGNNPYSVTVAGRYAYVANYGANTLQVFDVSTPANPVSVGTVGTGSNPAAVATAGRYAYVANYGAGTLQVFDLGGAYVQQLEAGTIETGTLQTRDTLTVGNNLDVRGGLTASGSARISGGLSVDNGTNLTVKLIETSSGAYLSAAGVWTSVSDRAAKEGFTAIEPEDVLAKVAALPITQWKYKVEPDGMKHIGPVAQDFYGAFGLGDSAKAIGAIDETGVALAAIQGLNQKLEEKDAEIAELRARLDKLEKLQAQKPK
jgi:hypothetical protein